ncbi:MAG: nitrous oxide reductase family maturation protein NosD [Candidatus Heimdallarchaeota archaeon]
MTIKTFFLFFLVLFSMNLMLANHNSSKSNFHAKTSSNLKISEKHQVFDFYSPIVINGNQEMEDLATSEGWSGTGSADNPFILENLEFSSMSVNYQLEINNTNHHFIIRNSKFSDGGKGGIKLDAVSNALITDNIFINNSGDALFLVSSSNAIISHNVINGTKGIPTYSDVDGFTNYPFSIDVRRSTDIIVEHNLLYNNHDGIWLWLNVSNSIVRGNEVYNTIVYEGLGAGGSTQSFNNIIRDNIIDTIGRYGLWVLSDTGGSIFENNTIRKTTSKAIFLSNVQNSTITNNTVDHAGTEGVHIAGPTSVFNSMRHNLIINSQLHGLRLEGGNNLVQENTFIDNNKGNGKQAIQFSQGPNQITHNYWNDWTSPDTDNDGIVDNPYVLDGIDGQDNFPLVLSPRERTNTSSTTPSTTSFGVITNTVLAFGITIILKKIKNRPRI